MATTPKFHDKTLLAAVAESASELESFQQQLTEATSDMKELEIWLQTTGFCIDVYIDIQNGPYHNIGWDKIDGKWRLAGKYWSEDDRELCIRALCESSAKSRLACRQHLPTLIKAITEQYTSLSAPTVAEHSDDIFAAFE